jgi:hypothetical protein
MILTTETLLSTTVYGTASGNYDGSSQDFFSDVKRAANYYQGQGSIQTVTLQVQGFVGRIRLQATLNDDPAAALWFEVYDYDRVVPTTEYHPVSLVGNYVWLRAEITDFSAGTITGITASY